MRLSFMKMHFPAIVLMETWILSSPFGLKIFRFLLVVFCGTKITWATLRGHCVYGRELLASQLLVPCRGEENDKLIIT